MNVPSLSDVVEFSLVSLDQFSFSSINTSAFEMYPSTTAPVVFLYPSTFTEAELDTPPLEQEIE